MKMMYLCRLWVSITIDSMFPENKVLLVYSSIAYKIHLC